MNKRGGGSEDLSFAQEPVGGNSNEALLEIRAQLTTASDTPADWVANSIVNAANIIVDDEATNRIWAYAFYNARTGLKTEADLYRIIDGCYWLSFAADYLASNRGVPMLAIRGAHVTFAKTGERGIYLWTDGRRTSPHEYEGVALEVDQLVNITPAQADKFPKLGREHGINGHEWLLSAGTLHYQVGEREHLVDLASEGLMVLGEEALTSLFSDLASRELDYIERSETERLLEEADLEAAIIKSPITPVWLAMKQLGIDTDKYLDNEFENLKHFWYEAVTAQLEQYLRAVAATGGTVMGLELETSDVKAQLPATRPLALAWLIKELDLAEEAGVTLMEVSRSFGLAPPVAESMAEYLAVTLSALNALVQS